MDFIGCCFSFHCLSKSYPTILIQISSEDPHLNHTVLTYSHEKH